MTRGELEHAIRAACDIAQDSELYVFGSQAILGQYPDAPAMLRQSAEVDVAPRNHPERAIDIDGAIGELSQFHRTNNFYVHGLSIESAVLPDGWRDRLIAVRNENTRGCTGWCVEGHDLAASKLAAFREKDRSFVRGLMIEKIVNPETLRGRIDGLPPSRVPDDLRSRILRWLDATIREL